MATVTIDNPYFTGYILLYDGDESSLERDRLKYEKSIYDKIHIVTEADTIWSLAFDNYGNSRYYWILQDINDLENAWSLEVGKAIIIPDLVRIKTMMSTA